MSADVIDGEDVGMVERRGRAGFLLETTQSIRPAGDRRSRQDLQGDIAAQTLIARTIDFAHAASAEKRDDLVGPKTSAGGKSHDSVRTIEAVIVVRGTEL